MIKANDLRILTDALNNFLEKSDYESCFEYLLTAALEGDYSVSLEKEAFDQSEFDMLKEGGFNLKNYKDSVIVSW